ncbi:hypothetical protein M8J75_003039 [Diaphorina citri]|nr:hypothetical protein M8J75_003039 [Diaphorina citri]
MLESGFTSCEDELLENVTASLVSSAYTDDGGTWKSSSGSTVESLTKCEDLDLEDSPPPSRRGISPERDDLHAGERSPRPGHKPPRWSDITPRGGHLSPRQPDSLEPLSPRTEARPFRRSGIPVVHHHQTHPLQTKLLTKCQSLQDLSKCLALIHPERLNNTYNSTDTINSQSLSSTKDSGFQRSYSSNSICSVRRRNKYDHVESKVKQYIRNIKDNERKHKALKRNSLHVGPHEDSMGSRRSSLQDTELLGDCTSGGSKSRCNTRRSSYQDELRVLFNIDVNMHYNMNFVFYSIGYRAPWIPSSLVIVQVGEASLAVIPGGDTELLGDCTSGGSKSCCNTRRSSYQDELRVLFNIDDESNRALTTLIKKLEVEKFERDLLIENLQVKYHELNNKLTSANETISDLKQQVTLSPLITSSQCLDEPLATSSTSKPRAHHRRYTDRSHNHHHARRRLSPVQSHNHHHARRRLSPVQSLSSYTSRTTKPLTAPHEPPCCSSRSSQNSSRPNRQTAAPACRKKLNLPRDDPFIKRWQDSLTGVESSDSAPSGSPAYSHAFAESSPLQKSTTLPYLPSTSQATPFEATPTGPLAQVPPPSHTLPSRPESSRTYFKAFDSSFHLGRSKTSPDIKRATVYINIGNHSKKSKDSNLCPPDEKASEEPEKQITVLNIYEAEDGTKIVQDVSKRRSCSTGREQTGSAKVHVASYPVPPPRDKSSSRTHQSLADQPARPHQSLADAPARNHQSLADQPARNHQSLADQPARHHQSLADDLSISKPYRSLIYKRNYQSLADELSKADQSLGDLSSKDHQSLADSSQDNDQSSNDQVADAWNPQIIADPEAEAPVLKDSPVQTDISGVQTEVRSVRPSYGLSLSKTTPNMKRVSINLSTEVRSSSKSTESSEDSLNTTTEDDEQPRRRPPSVPPNTRLFKELSSLKSCLNEVDEQIHVLKHGIDNLIKSSSQKSVNTFLQQP